MAGSVEAGSGESAALAELCRLACAPDWSRLGDRFYCRQFVCAARWDVRGTRGPGPGLDFDQKVVGGVEGTGSGGLRSGGLGGLDFDSLEAHLVAGAPLGGAVAIVRESRESLPARGAGGTGAVSAPGVRTQLHVRASSGNAIASRAWERARVVGLGWLESEKLAILSEDGSVCILSVSLEIVRELRLPDKLVAEGLAVCVVLPSGSVFE
ncbi:hypothetical protein T492DRAFT_890888 [Pavlovales sp. CCMP2436]|nr:hypothetical protein T492DRAFT_890888 [Pavlovales sp. CCMP2436]